MPQLILTIANGSDDADANSLTALISTTSFFGRRDQAYLFAGASLLVGTTILSAVLRLTSNAAQGGSAHNDELYLEDSDNAAPFSNGEAYSVYAGRPRTSVVSWPQPTTLTLNEVFESPDISALVQDVIDRPGFVDRLHVFFQSIPPDTATYRVTHFESDPAKSAQLVIDYEEDEESSSSASSSSTASLSSSSTDHIIRKKRHWRIGPRPFLP